MIMNVIYDHCFRSSLTTYKELCSLASDLNQPDMMYDDVYKFMHLANHNALWNSKKGRAFMCTVLMYIAQACILC